MPSHTVISCHMYTVHTVYTYFANNLIYIHPISYENPKQGFSLLQMLSSTIYLWLNTLNFNDHVINKEIAVLCNSYANSLQR